MIRSSLPSEVFSRYKTDKNSGIANGGHSYADNFYDFYLPRFRWCSAVLEIGIAGGESLRAFAEYFSDATIVGLDVVKGRLVNEGRIRSLLVDCSDPHQLSLFAEEYTNHFSFICDDGSHLLADQLLGCRTLKKCLRKGGMYVVEDVNNSQYSGLFANEGFTTVEWDCDRRFDNRICYYLNV